MLRMGRKGASAAFARVRTSRLPFCAQKRAARRLSQTVTRVPDRPVAWRGRQNITRRSTMTPMTDPDPWGPISSAPGPPGPWPRLPSARHVNGWCWSTSMNAMKQLPVSRYYSSTKFSILAFEALKIQRVNFITPKLGAPCINLGQISCDGESSTAIPGT